MSYINLSNHGTTPFERLLGHVPAVLAQWDKLERAFFQSKTFPPDFLEQIRRALAFHNQCQYCMAKAGPPSQNLEDNRLNEALRFANNYAISHDSIDEQAIQRLKNYFSESEIVELTAFCSFISASQKFGASLGLQAASNYAAHVKNAILDDV
jgi:alkylhydroperoxidase family enzyme